MTDPRGRQPIGIAQPPGQGGTNYPLINPSADIKQLFADICLTHAYSYGDYTTPLRIKWLYGFGADAPIGTPPTVTHAYDIEIVDDLGNTVFSSIADGTTFKEEAWGTRLKVLTWIQLGQHQQLTVVIHTEWSPEDVPITYPIYWEPVSAVLDARTLMESPPRINRIQLGLSQFSFGDIQFKNGYNTTFTTEATVTTPGQRRITPVVLEASSGSGLGKFGPPCQEADDGLRRINGVSPTERGQFYLDAGGCYRVERPLVDAITPLPARRVRVWEHALGISSDCGPCCECDDFIAVWEAIRKLRNRYATLVGQAQAIRDLYHTNRQRFLTQQSCRENDRLRLILRPSCPAQLGVAVGYCNNGSECLVGLVIHVSFAYSDVNNCPDVDGTPPLTATTTAPFSTVVCDSTFRGGFVDSSRKNNRKFVRNEYYTLGGSWPHFWVHFPLVDPGAMAFVTFRLQFDNPTNNDVVEAVADAFQTGSQTTVTGGTPVSGYTPGSGCGGGFCASPTVHLVTCPIKETSKLIPECCEESVSLT